MASDAVKPTGWRGSWVYSLVVWLVMTLFAAPVLLAWNLWDPLDYLPYFVCLGVGVTVAIGAWRINEQLPSAAAHGFLRLAVICWLPCLAVGVGLAANTLLDRSPAATHAAVFLGYHHPQKGQSRVRFASWRKSGTEERLTCSAGRSQAVCLNLKPGDPVTVTTHSGALGWEWVAHVAPR